MPGFLLGEILCGPYRARTDHLLNAIEALYQMS